MKRLLIMLFAAIGIIGCEDSKPTTAANGSLLVKFQHLYNGDSLIVLEDNNLIYNTLKGNNFNIKNIKYFISKLKLTKSDGSEYDVNMYRLLNPMEANINYQQYQLNAIPEGKYVKLSFLFGIDTVRNVFPFGLENNSENNSMEWPYTLGGGYHFMMLEGVFRNNRNDTVGYAIHLGKTPNQIYNEFPIDLTIVNSITAQTTIKVNVEKWFDGINEIDLNDGFGYIMEDDAKQLLFKQNGSLVFSNN